MTKRSTPEPSPRERRAPPAPGLSATALIAERYASLSPGHRRVADFILSSPHEAALMTLRAIAEVTGVSEATVNRLGTKLGLGGHPELKEQLRLELKEALRPVEDFTDRLKEEAAARRAPWTESIQEDLQRISRIQPVGGDGAFAQASKLLADARSVYVVGFGSSAFIAQYAAFCLSALRGGCRALTDSSGVEGVERKILDAGPQDVGLHLAFARYSRPALSAAKHLHGQGVPLVCITDGPDSPLVSYAATCFLVERKSSFVLSGSGTGAMAVVEALLRGVAAALGHEAISRRSARLTSLLESAVIPPKDGADA